jgi:type I restriction enzyme, R subunit
MSKLLDALIELRRKQAIEYKEYLQRLSELAKQVLHPEAGSYPPAIKTAAQRALFDNLDGNEDLVLRLDAVIKATRKDSWRGSRMKEREIRNAIRRTVDLVYPSTDVDVIFDLVKHQDEY